jgi:steroid delta-isomerase-like uncharacterized protein
MIGPFVFFDLLGPLDLKANGDRGADMAASAYRTVDGVLAPDWTASQTSSSPPSRRARASKNEENVMATKIGKEHVQQWLDAGNTLNSARFAEVLADDVVMHQPQNPKPLDKKAIIMYFGMLWNAFPDMHFEGVGSTIEGNEAASWERVTGTLKAAYTDPASGEEIQPTGRSFDLFAAMRLTFNNYGKIAEVRIFWDRLDFMQQLGLL